MFCQKCGNQMADGAAFCQKCGAKVMVNEAVQQPTKKPVSINAEKTISKAPGIPMSKETEKIYQAETDMLKCFGGQIAGYLGSSRGRGRIRLTNKRLIHETLSKKVKLELNMNDIVSYQKAYSISLLLSWVLPIPKDNAFVVYTKQGIAYKFAAQKKKRDALLQLFKQVIPTAEQLPDETKREAKKRAWFGINTNDKQAASQRKVVISLAAMIILLAIIGTVASILEESAASRTGVISGKLMYNETSVITYLGIDINQVMKKLGPFEYDDYYEGGQLKGYYVGHRFIGFIHNDEGKVTWITADSELLKFNGVTLDKDRAGLIVILGEPISDGYDEEYGDYYMIYDYESHFLRFLMDSPDGTAYRLEITTND
jgi:hypothetical protein